MCVYVCNRQPDLFVRNIPLDLDHVSSIFVNSNSFGHCSMLIATYVCVCVCVRQQNGLLNIFSKAGPIRGAQIKIPNEPGKQPFAFVKYENKTAMATAITMFNNYKLGGNFILVREFTPRSGSASGPSPSGRDSRSTSNTRASPMTMRGESPFDSIRQYKNSPAASTAGDDEGWETVVPKAPVASTSAAATATATTTNGHGQAQVTTNGARSDVLSSAHSSTTNAMRTTTPPRMTRAGDDHVDATSIASTTSASKSRTSKTLRHLHNICNISLKNLCYCCCCA